MAFKCDGKTICTPQFPKVKGNFGFGCMRLPLLENGEVDIAHFSKMVDAFMASGFNYFDTAHGYLDGKSETALCQALTKRYKREDYVLVDKLSPSFFESREDIRPFFESQLKATGVEYFDFYLMHSQKRSIYSKYKSCSAYEEALQLKKEGKIKHFGISFHDSAEFLDEILTDYPEIEMVQIQFNYADYDDAAVQSRAVYEVCKRHGRPIAVMEPIKGGRLAELPEEARKIAEEAGCSPAELAIRFVAGHEGVFMTLSGMGSMQMMHQNLAVMKNFKPLSNNELKAISEINAILKGKGIISCTTCRYCVAGCPAGIKIPDLFACANNKTVFPGDWNPLLYYGIHTELGGKASSCIGCGACESICPQHLPIRKLLADIAREFEKSDGK